MEQFPGRAHIPVAEPSLRPVMVMERRPPAVNRGPLPIADPPIGSGFEKPPSTVPQKAMSLSPGTEYWLP